MRESQITSQSAGISSQNANTFTDFRAETAEAIEILANAAITDKKCYPTFDGNQSGTKQKFNGGKSPID